MRRGYSTEADRAEARAGGARARIVPLRLPEFHELLKWGVLMGVDDGCEPEVEELAAATAAEHGLSNRRGT
jgi:hypothetical protein